MSIDRDALDALVTEWREQAKIADDSAYDGSAEKDRLITKASTFQLCATQLAEAIPPAGEATERDPVRLELEVMDKCLTLMQRLSEDSHHRAVTWLKSRLEYDRMAAAQAEYKRRQAAEQDGTGE